MEKKSMGSFLTALRKASGLTQKQLAEKLNVSDKAVSRWERDECAPDLSLIPVLGEIYGVTSDEILQGQRMDPERVQHGSDRAKAEKQRKRILTSTKIKFVSRSLITAAVTMVGLIIAYIFNFEFAKANTGFLLGCIFFIAAFVCQFSFLISSLGAITEDEWQDAPVHSCKGAMLLASEWCIGGILTAFGFCIPLIGEHAKEVSLADCVFNGIKWALLAIVVTMLISISINHYLKRRGMVNMKLPANKLRSRCSTALCLVILLLLGLQVGLNGFLTQNRRLYAPHDICTSLISFKNRMEQPRSEDGVPMSEEQSDDDVFIYTVHDDYSPMGTPVSRQQYRLREKDITKQLIKVDAQPGDMDDPFTEEFGYQFRHLNLYLPYYEISDTTEIVPIYTFNTEQLEEANAIALQCNLFYLTLYIIAGTVVTLVYWHKQKKL